jgi:predicted Zn-ribbon and HTH transcriptional regulator
MDDQTLEQFREFFRQKYAHLELPDTLEGLRIAARMWEAEQEQHEEHAADNVRHILRILDDKDAELELAGRAAKNERGHFQKGNKVNSSTRYDPDIYLPEIERRIGIGMGMNQAIRQTAAAYVKKYLPDADVDLVYSAMRKKYQRKSKK